MKRFKVWIFYIERLVSTSLSFLNLILFSCSLIVLSRIGIPNANVFPVPVLARAIKSCPFNAGSSTALWKWEGNKSEFAKKSFKQIRTRTLPKFPAKWAGFETYLNRTYETYWRKSKLRHFNVDNQKER